MPSAAVAAKLERSRSASKTRPRADAGHHPPIAPAEVAAHFSRGRLLALLTGNAAGRLDAGAAPFTRAPGTVKDQDIQPSDPMLDASKLRLRFTETVIRTDATAPVTQNAAATRAKKGQDD